MNKAIVFACVAVGPVHFSPAALGSTAESLTEYVVEYDREDGMFRVSYETWMQFPASGPLTASAATQR